LVLWCNIKQTVCDGIQALFRCGGQDEIAATARNLAQVFQLFTPLTVNMCTGYKNSQEIPGSKLRTGWTISCIIAAD